MIFWLIISILDIVYALIWFISGFERTNTKTKFSIISGAIILFIIGIFLLCNTIRNIRDDAIEHYIRGDYELVEKTVNGETTKIHYRLIND